MQSTTTLSTTNLYRKLTVLLAAIATLALTMAAPAMATVSADAPANPKVDEEKHLTIRYTNDTNSTEEVNAAATISGPVNFLDSIVTKPNGSQEFSNCDRVESGSDTVLDCPSSIFVGPGESVTYDWLVSYPQAGSIQHTLSVYTNGGPEERNFTVSVQPSGPQSKADCKDNGWKAYGFHNQGACVDSLPKAEGTTAS